MPLSASEWHQRFRQQARWTRQLRQYLFEQIGISTVRRLLEVGCGTGALLPELPMTGSSAIHPLGLDLNWEYLSLAAQNCPRCPLTLGDGHALPFASASFDLTCCHYLLLWVREPVSVVMEMRRVTRSGGWVIALAEPDYGGRIDYPDSLAKLGEWQGKSLLRQGADPHIGRKLQSIFRQAGLREVHSGLLGGEWEGQPTMESWKQEWNVLEEDLIGWASTDVFEKLKKEDQLAWELGFRVLFVPTFYALGKI